MARARAGPPPRRRAPDVAGPRRPARVVLDARRRRVLFVGATDGSIGGRIEAIRNTALGDRRPHPGGHWLHALTGLDGARVWWAATAAVEESEDALLTAFAATIPAAERAALHDPSVVLPFANLRTATGERKATGLANSLVPADPVRADAGRPGRRGRRRAPRRAPAG